MAEIEKEKRGLQFGIGEGGALTDPQWVYERVLVDGETRESLGRVCETATVEEITAQLGEAFANLQASTNSLQQTLAERTAERDAALAVLTQVREAEAWNEALQEAMASVLDGA